MAIKAEITTSFGETRECYIRLNSMEVSNHGVPARALFRGFLTQEAFEGGANYVWEKDIEFEADLTTPLWAQAYAQLAEQEAVDLKEI